MLKRPLTTLLSIFLCTIVLSCSKKAQDQSLASIGGTPGTGSGTGGGGAVVTPITVPAGTYKLELTTPAYTSHMIHNSTGFTDKCELSSAQTGAARFITCFIEVDEYDLIFQGLSWDMSTSNSCQYVEYTPYYYMAAPAGVGRTTIAYTKNATGAIVVQNDASGKPYTDSTGVPLCDYNYSTIDKSYPNCCSGKYALTVTDQSTSTVTTTVNNDWGGSVGACVTGAGTQDPMSSAGIPKTLSFEIPTSASGVRLSQKYKGTINKDATVIFTSQMDPGFLYPVSSYFANYYTPSLWPGSLAPQAMRPDTSIASRRSANNASYVYSCFDSAREELARITVIVRKWNQRGLIGPSGNPDTGGTEPITGGPINDFPDWDDIQPAVLNLGGFPNHPVGYPFIKY